MHKKTLQKRLANALVFCLLAVLAVSFLYPVYFMAINAFKTKAEYRATPFALPSQLRLDNFNLLIGNFKILDSYWNTLQIALGSVALTITLAVFASYGFAKLPFKGRGAVYVAVVATMFIPAQVTMIPLYYLMSHLRVTNKLISVVLAYTATSLPGSILLMTTGFRGISDEMIEAATIDGAGYFAVVKNVILPMGVAVIAINIIFNFLSASNDLFTPMILLQKIDKRTIMVALSAIMSSRSADPAYQIAGLLLSALPSLAVYMLFNRFIVKGITVGSIK
ncbi:MAG: carbohydrate ABC transporter permease [Oscillospiraceae bacterium]|nr:carbohydrate ABC transporter permease [Oscillospiraceae bacterium]